jgi:hypothetical protein
MLASIQRDYRRATRPAGMLTSIQRDVVAPLGQRGYFGLLF